MLDSHHIKRIFDEVADLPRTERRTFLDQACGEDASVRHEVESLLRAMEDGSGFMAGTGLEKELNVHGKADRTEEPGTVIGRYTLMKSIGEGGFGAVFLAEQREPVKRTVALKIIKLGMDTTQVIARFEAERQALAMMDHPNVAKVFDAGATDRRTPTFTPTAPDTRTAPCPRAACGR